MAFTDQYALGIDATFLQRITVAVLKAATAVQAEDPAGLAKPVGFTGPVGALHALRVHLANAILDDHATWSARFSAVVAADPNTAGITANSTDSDLLFTINSLFNTFAVTG